MKTRCCNICVLLLSISAFAIGAKAAASQISPSSGFQFSQIDTICAMPVVDGMHAPNLPIDGSFLRPLVMMALEDRGYHVESPACSDATRQGESKATPSRWRLTVTFDSLLEEGNVILGCSLTASLFDTQTQSEVWRATAHTNFGHRFVRALAGPQSEIMLADLFREGLGPVLESMPKRGGPARPLPSTSWPPISFQAVAFFKRGKGLFQNECQGVMQATSDSLSFTPSAGDSKCKKYQFTVLRNRIKSCGRMPLQGPAASTPAPSEAFDVIAPGVGRIDFYSSDVTSLNYLFASLGSGI